MRRAFFLILVIGACFNAQGGRDGAISGVDHVATANAANKQLDFYYYIPAQVAANRARACPLIVCVPGLSGRGESFVGPEIKAFADEMGAVVIAPSFVWDQENWDSQTSYQYPQAWSGNALLSIVETVKTAQGLEFTKFCLLGFSAGAQFCLRFAVWKPELCLACAAHGPGGAVFPASASSVKFLVGIGKDDIQDRRDHAEYFCETARKWGIEAELKEYPGGHEFSDVQLADSLALFRKAILGR